MADEIERDPMKDIQLKLNALGAAAESQFNPNRDEELAIVILVFERTEDGGHAVWTNSSKIGTVIAMNEAGALLLSADEDDDFDDEGGE